MNWKPITSPSSIEHLVSRSYVIPCIIYKHSTHCSLSAIARYRLESSWSFSDDTLEAYFLDLIAYRDLSQTIADRFQVYHESPQLLLIKNGECVYEESHLDISVLELEELVPSLV